MKTRYAILMAIVLTNTSSHAQGTFVYDQQSADESSSGESALTIHSAQPFGQSFTPSLSSVGFIRLETVDATVNNVGATLYVNLRSDSISGPILGSTQPVSMPDRFSGHMNFIFPTPIVVTPGVAYFFQPVVQSGDMSWVIGADRKWNYPGGMLFSVGQPAPEFDLWFREGIIVPEPRQPLLWLLGIVALGAFKSVSNPPIHKSPCQ